MKEKRYYCDWALSSSNERFDRLTSKVLLIASIVVTAVSSLIYYNIMMPNQDLEAYSESAYKYLDEIADNVIGENGINVAAIPEDVDEYEITYKDDEIIFMYSLGNNRGKLFEPSTSMTVTLSKDFDILSKEPNFSSREEYVKKTKRTFYKTSLLFGLFISLVMAIASCIVIIVLRPISVIHKKMDMKK